MGILVLFEVTAEIVQIADVDHGADGGDPVQILFIMKRRFHYLKAAAFAVLIEVNVFLPGFVGVSGRGGQFPYFAAAEFAAGAGIFPVFAVDGFYFRIRRAHPHRIGKIVDQVP